MSDNNQQSKRIGIDARFYGPVGKGLGRYTQEIVDNIIKMDHENEYIIFLRKENFNELEFKAANVKKVLADVRWYSLAEQILMPFYIWREKLDLMHFPHFNVPIFCPTKFIVTIHDLILIRYPTKRATTLGPLFYKIKNWVYRVVILLAVKRAKKIIAVSQFTRDDIIKQFKIEKDKVKVTYEGVAVLTSSPHSSSGEASQPSLLHPSRSGKPEIPPRGGVGIGQGERGEVRPDDKEVFLRYNIDSPFLLYVGNAYPHKNLEGLVNIFVKIRKTSPLTPLLSKERGKLEKGFKKAPFSHEKRNGRRAGDEGLQLVLVGKDDYFYKRVQQYARDLDLWSNKKQNNPVVFPGYVPDRQLEIFYSQARAYVFPSFYEGFGLPPLEAMAKGCPVVSSNKTSMPEVLGQAAIYFNPDNEEEMQKQIERIIRDENLREGLIKKGFEQVKKYSWQECARKTLDVYKKITL